MPYPRMNAYRQVIDLSGFWGFASIPRIEAAGRQDDPNNRRGRPSAVSLPRRAA
jgi:hypothetical protein